MKDGGRLALSDDSHGPGAVGLNYEKVAAYLQHLAVSELWFLRRADVPNAGGRKLEAVKLDGEWQDHKFWKCLKSG